MPFEPLQLSSVPSHTLSVPFTTNLADEVPDTTNADPRLKPLVASPILVGAANASAPPPEEVDAVDKYIATLSSPAVQFVVLPSIRMLDPLLHISNVSSLPLVQLLSKLVAFGVNFILSENSMTIHG